MHWIIHHTLILRNHSNGQRLKQAVATYPEVLKTRIIQHQLAIWEHMVKVPAIFVARHVAARGELPDFLRRQLLGIHSILIILYAYNQMWMPDTKWCLIESIRLTTKPTQSAERIRLILLGNNVFESIRDLLVIMIETATIMQEQFAIEALIQVLQALRDEQP